MSDIRMGEGTGDATLVEAWCHAVTRLFREGDAALPDVLALYDEQVEFQDPLETGKGLPALAAYNARFMRKVERVDIVFGDVLEGDRVAFAAWTMHIAPRLGPATTVDGVTQLRIQDGKIAAQRDHFDVAGSIPVLGRVVRWLVRTLIA